ncbi:hypothetical protein AWENTII_011987 [Aspergillus wentii]|nr:hypothetical protein MW887_005689 [Aspergillus wentii]
MLALILSSLLTLYIINTIKNLLHHRNRAIQTGLPYILLPVSEHNIAYLLLFETRFLIQLIRLLPPWLADYFYISSFKSRWCAKERFHEKYGPVYLIASPGSLTCAVADAGAISQIFMDRRGFPKPVEQYEPVAIFGPNVVTCSDQDWSHHHRYTSTTFNEKNNALVWSETIRQVKQMTEYWVDEYSTSPTEFLLSSPRDDILKFTLNIICSAGFGVKLPFRPAPEATTEDALGLFKDAISPPPGFHFTFRGVMGYLHHNIMSVFVANGLPKWIPRGCFPFFKRTFEADDDLRKYLRALLEETRQSGVKNHNLLEGMVQSQTESESSRDKGLSNDEVLGNICYP